MLTLNRVHGLVGTAQKQKNTLAQHFLDIISERARSYETINLIGTQYVRTYRVYS